MRRLIGMLVCKITKKHKRGKRTEGEPAFGMHEFKCPRCGGLWYRKARNAK